MRDKLKSKFLSVDNPTYDKYAETFQAKPLISQILYISTYLLPGVVAYCLVNIEPVHRFFSGVPGLAT